MLHSRAQVSAEFMIIFAFVAGAFILAAGIIFDMIIDSRSQDVRNGLDSLGDLVFNEVMLASVVQDNYERFFYLPATINGVDYMIDINHYSPPESNNSEVKFYVESGDELSYTKTVFLPHVDMISFEPGCNMITKSNSSISIEAVNQEKCE
ncbi:MAG: hypothetical protein ACLFTR_02840 [Candidatus Woesearchaeota archaeon]